jgi:precorrin-6A synthase
LALSWLTARPDAALGGSERPSPPMRRMLLIGIGVGDPDHLTLQAVKALRLVDVFFVLDKGPEKDALAALRREICRRHLGDRLYSTVTIQDPKRDRQPACYESAVLDWHQLRASEYERAIQNSLADGQCGAFLVWGDASLYDSTLRILEQVRGRGKLAFEIEVIPGITSIQALTARHSICLNKIGQSVHITPARNLPHCLPTQSDNVVVMLDGEFKLEGIDPKTTMIHWGAYIGTPDEILISGLVADVLEHLQTVRREARARHGWIMDTYLLSKA